MQLIKIIIFFLSSSERKFLSLLLFLTLLVAILDMIGVASILPFMAVLTDPDVVEKNRLLNESYKYFQKFGIENKDQFLIIIGSLVFVLLLISLFFKALITYLQLRFVHLTGYNISKRLVEGYLNQPYSWFLNRNSADLGKNIISEVNVFVGYVNLILDVIAKSMAVILLIILIIIVDPKLALIITLVVGSIYLVIYFVTLKYLTKIGDDRFKNNLLRFKAVNEVFGAIKEVKIRDMENNFSKNYSKPAKIFALTLASSGAIRELPRFAIEAVGFGGVMLIILYLISTQGAINNIIPIISLYVFAGYRLMPAVQKIYSNFSKISFFDSSVFKLYQDTKSLDLPLTSQNKTVLTPKKIIKLKGIYYNYPNSSRTVLKNINMNINVKSTVGIVGATGSGKTTTIDIILGLLDVQKGTLEVDDKIINNHNVKDWQSCIGYVPQEIYLIDSTIAANIAFGIAPEDIDQKALEKASKISNLHQFVLDELPKQYQTTIGERGVRLSGGQRQRIGIARALYHNPKVLILDEATSALDNQTERVVMEAIDNLNNNITIIMIAHRLSTVKKCDNIYLLEDGEIKHQGSFEQLIKLDESFRLNSK
jgi:ABC-type multidrug transport system fused ATPase/permease subunit